MKQTRFGWIVLGLLGLAIAGCSLGKPESSFSKPSTSNSTNIPSFSVEAGQSSLAIVHGTDKVSIGDPYFRWEEMFPRPNKSAFAIRELPKPLSGDGLLPIGWETPNKGFGAIRDGNKLVLAMIWESKVSHSEAAKISAEYDRYNQQLSSQVVAANGSHYTFWENNSIRMMLYVQKKGEDAYNVTLTLGQIDLMNAIRASAQQAQNDLASLYPNSTRPGIKVKPPSVRVSGSPAPPSAPLEPNSNPKTQSSGTAVSKPASKLGSSSSTTVLNPNSNSKPNQESQTQAPVGSGQLTTQGQSGAVGGGTNPPKTGP